MSNPIKRLREMLRPLAHAYFRQFPGPHPHSAVRCRLAAEFLQGRGLEIGALNFPQPLPHGVQVSYVDRRTREQSRALYTDLDGQPLVHVDIIDDGEHLETIPNASQGFVVANHFLEHCQDPIGTLLSHLRVLRPGGILFLAIPDARHTFDAGRPLTPLSHVVRDYEDGPAWSRRGHFAEFFAHRHGLQDSALESRVNQALEADEDTHYHVWTVETFREVVDHLAHLASVQVERLTPNGAEFMCVLRKMPL